jgi:hypothetical protein
MQQKDYVIKARYLVRGPDRTATGHPYYFCAGRGWSKEWLQVSLVAGEQNPVEEIVLDPKTNTKGDQVILDMINEEQLKELRADDQNIVVREINDDGTAKDDGIDVPALQKRLAELESGLAKLSTENDDLKKKLSETNALLEEATKPAVSMAGKMANRRGK